MCQRPGASDNQIKAMQDVVRDGIKAGALGLSVSREKGHYDPQGVHIPALWADEQEIFALGDVLREMGTGTIQAGGGQYVELKDGMIRRLAEATGRTVVYNSLSQTMRKPDEWKVRMARVEETAALGIRAYPMCTPNRIVDHFTMRNCQEFRGLPTWHPILLASDEEKLRAYSNPEIRKKLHAEAVEFKVDTPPPGICRTWWDYMEVQTAVLQKNKVFERKTVGEIAQLPAHPVAVAVTREILQQKNSVALDGSDIRQRLLRLVGMQHQGPIALWAGDHPAVLTAYELMDRARHRKPGRRADPQEASGRFDLHRPAKQTKRSIGQQCSGRFEGDGRESA